MKDPGESNVDLVKICLECEADGCTGTCAKFQALHKRVTSGDGQYMNTRRKRSPPRFYTYNGKTQSTARWAMEYGISRDTINSRINRGMSIEDALTLPLYSSNSTLTCNGKTLPYKDWGGIAGIDSETIRSRIKSGWPAEKAIFTPPKRRNTHDSK